MPSIARPYGHSIRVAQIVVAISALSLVAGFIARATASWNWGYFVLGGPVLVLALMILGILSVTGRAMQRQISALVGGDHWAHWTYGDAEWSSFTEAEWKRAAPKAVKLGVQVFGGMLVLGLVLHLLVPDVPIASGLLIGGALGGVVGLLAGASTYSIDRSTRQARLAGVGEVYIGETGVYQAGGFTAWSGSGWKLASVTMNDGTPSILEFKITSTQSRDGTVRVAVPSGKEAEAKKLLGRFHRTLGSVSTEHA